MKTNIDNLFVSFMLLDEKERLRKTQKATNRLAKYLSEDPETSDKMVFSFFINVVSLFVSANNHCGEEEWKLFNDILEGNYSYNAFYQATNGGAEPQFKEKMYEQIRVLPRRIKNDIVTIGMAFLISDKELSESEKEVFEHVLNG